MAPAISLLSRSRKAGRVLCQHGSDWPEAPTTRDLCGKRSKAAVEFRGKRESTHPFFFLSMQRRAVLEVFRRQGVVDLSCAVRHRKSPIFVPRRPFRSSIAYFKDTSDPSAGEDGSEGASTPRPKFAAPRFQPTENANTPRPLFSAPRFGGAGADGRDQSTSHPLFSAPKFGAQAETSQPQPSIRLSPAEQALRDRLLERKRQEEEARRAEEMQREQQLMRRRQPFGPGRHFDTTNTRQIPPYYKNLRSQNWPCPQCGLNCFGKFMRCPRCDCLRPNLPPALNQAPTEAGEGGRAARWAPVAKPADTPMARPVDEAGSPGAERTSHPEQKVDTTPRKQAPAHAPISVEPLQAVSQTAETRETQPPAIDITEQVTQEGEEIASDQSRETKPEKTKTKDDPWAWDVSSLKYLEKEAQQQEPQQPRKDTKRQSGRKQRTYDAEEEMFDEDESRRRRDERKRSKNQRAREKELEAAPSPLYLPDLISVGNLADVIGVRPAQFVERMEEMGFEGVTYSHILDSETAGIIALEYNFEPIFESGGEDLTAAPEPEDPSSLPPRPPVVTIMGHVDHGKTTILDWLRKSSIAAGEHGGITQHIGAFSVAMPSGQTITFLDTPGHAAFLEMRRRGADVTDIVVLVVAADDSVKPQTVEAIRHATQAGVPIVVAASKVDKEGANIEKVKQDLSVHGVHVEDYGGDVQVIGVSGKTGQGMLDLEEAIVTLSEMLDHRADKEGNVEGWVIESSTKSYGRVTSILVKRGTLRPGDIVVAGAAWARVRTLRNEAGITIEEATPGMPVEIDGWREQPTAGTEMLQASDEQMAKDVVQNRIEKTETQKMGEDATAINEARREVLGRRRQEEAEENGEQVEHEETTSGPKGVHFIVKADVHGSSEAVVNSVTAIGNNEVYPNVLRSAVGPVGEFDIEHAASAGGSVISFNMPVDPAMYRMAEQRGVKIMDHNVIYKLIDDVKEGLSGHLAPSVSQRVTGEAGIGQIFEITIRGREKTAIAGCRVRNGMVQRSKKVRVLRDQEIIYDGSMASLKNVKKDVAEMRKDTECGVSFDGWTAFEVGDHIQCYEDIYEKRYL